MSKGLRGQNAKSKIALWFVTIHSRQVMALPLERKTEMIDFVNLSKYIKYK